MDSRGIKIGDKIALIGEVTERVQKKGKWNESTINFNHAGGPIVRYSRLMTKCAEIQKMVDCLMAELNEPFEPRPKIANAYWENENGERIDGGKLVSGLEPFHVCNCDVLPCTCGASNKGK